MLCTRRVVWSMLVSCLVVSWSSRVATAEALKAIRIVIVGDSTVASFPEERQVWGWGQMVSERLQPEAVVFNHAQSGRSSKSFIDEGRWKTALADKPDYVLIQFGHNDQKQQDPKRYTDPATTYREHLQRYIADARQQGAQPVLVTSVARRIFDAQGKISTTLTPYADAMKVVAKAENVPLIDLHTSSLALFDNLGDAGSADLSCTADDRTHFSKKGARAIAGLVVEELRRVEPELEEYVK